MIRMDALVMDLLKGSPRIVNIYSYCGGSVHVEAIHGPSITELVELQKRSEMDNPPPMLTPKAKLNLALEMAEGLAELHGFKDGPITHHDIQIGQYLIDENHHARMSDFNRADPLLFDIKEQKYCDVVSGSAMGEVRSPEEYRMLDVNEKIDVYSFGNIIFTLLTGQYPYEDVFDDDLYEVGDLAAHGVTPDVNAEIRGNSFAESALASVMDKCYEYHSEKRINIFTVISLLQSAAELNNRLESIEVSQITPGATTSGEDNETHPEKNQNWELYHQNENEDYYYYGTDDEHEERDEEDEYYPHGELRLRRR